MARAKHQGKLRLNEANALANKVARQAEHQEMLNRHRDHKRGVIRVAVDEVVTEDSFDYSDVRPIGESISSQPDN